MNEASDMHMKRDIHSCRGEVAAARAHVYLNSHRSTASHKSTASHAVFALVLTSMFMLIFYFDPGIS